MSGLKKWFRENWVDIGAPKKGGGYEKCGRAKADGSGRPYPKCVPAAKAASNQQEFLLKKQQQLRAA